MHRSPRGPPWMSPFPNLKMIHLCKQPPHVSITTSPQFLFLSHSHILDDNSAPAPSQLLMRSLDREDSSNSVCLKGGNSWGSIWPVKQKRKTFEEMSVVDCGCAMVLTCWLQPQNLQIRAPGTRLGFITRLPWLSSLPSVNFSIYFRNKRFVSLFVPMKSAFIWSALLWKPGKKTFQKKLKSKETQHFLYIIHSDSAT